MALPLDLISPLRKLIGLFGESVTYTSPDGTETWTIVASVQVPVEAQLMQDFDQNALMVFVVAADVNVVPVSMGTVLVRGRTRTVEEVVVEAPQGIAIYYRLRVRG
jgi:hypothetical protein